MEYAVATDADLPAMHGRWRRRILVCHGQSEDWCRPLQILHDLETDEDVGYLLLPNSICGFGACVLDGEQNLHRASCGFGARHGRRRSVCDGEFACGSAAIRTFQE